VVYEGFEFKMVYQGAARSWIVFHKLIDCCMDWIDEQYVWRMFDDSTTHSQAITTQCAFSFKSRTRRSRPSWTKWI